MNGLDEQLEVVDCGVGEDAMPEIENVTGSTIGSPEHVARPQANEVRGAQQHRWIEVALNPPVMADSPPTFIQRHSPIQRNDVWTRFRD